MSLARVFGSQLRFGASVRPFCSAAYRLNFGKHKGTKLEDCPEDYQKWLINNRVYIGKPELGAALSQLGYSDLPMDRDPDESWKIKPAGGKWNNPKKFQSSASAWDHLKEFPGEWVDCRNNKSSDRSPCFKLAHSEFKDALWIDSKWTPEWVPSFDFDAHFKSE